MKKTAISGVSTLSGDCLARLLPDKRSAEYVATREVQKMSL